MHRCHDRRRGKLIVEKTRMEDCLSFNRNSLMELEHAIVDLVGMPSSISFSLYYVAHYDQGTYINYLQQLASNSVRGESSRLTYTKYLEKAVRSLVEGLPKGERFDLIVAPASQSKRFTPYLEAVRRAYPDARFYELKKLPDVSSGSADTSFSALLDATNAPEPHPQPATNVLIVDDIYANGKTAAVTITRLRRFMPEASFTVACALRAPDLKDKITLEDLPMEGE